MVPAADSLIKKIFYATAQLRESDAADRSAVLPRRGKTSVPERDTPRQTRWNLKYQFVIFSLINIFIRSLAFADEPYTLEKIVVKASSQGAQEAGASAGYSTEVISAEEIQDKGLNSVVDVLNYVSGVDLRYRGTFGIQADTSLRGSTYEQVAVLIDGVKVMDPQTGHFNLDIPLTAYDLERVEVIKGATGSLFGAGAFAGSINLVTKKPSAKKLDFETSFGQNALFGQAGSFSLAPKDYQLRASFDHKIAKAARPNTDFEYGTASFLLHKPLAQGNLDFLFGYQKKDFGADSFYSNLFPEEEEHTQTYFIKAGLESKLSDGKLKNNLYLRKHRDKFILRRNNPTSVNYHTTYVYGYNANWGLPTKFGHVAAGLDIGNEEINSTNLGKRSRWHEAALGNLVWDITANLSTDLGFRLDYFEKWHNQQSYNTGLSYKLKGERLKLKISYAGAFRLPSFTDLYYNDAANKSDPNLKVEKSDTLTVGAYSEDKFYSLGLEGFTRWGKDLIDYTRTTTAQPWQATNLGRVDFRGGVFSAGLKPEWKLPGFNLEETKLSYQYTDADKKSSDFLSKYALDILKHQLTLGIKHNLLGVDFGWNFSYNQRYYGETYFLAGIILSKKILQRDLTFEPYLTIDNLTNTKYNEVAGVLQPGRWIKGGVKFSW